MEDCPSAEKGWAGLVMVPSAEKTTASIPRRQQLIRRGHLTQLAHHVLRDWMGTGTGGATRLADV